jgi:hypothetical protein
MQRWYYPHTYGGLAVHLLIAAAVYGIGVLWVVTTKRAFHVRELAPKEMATAAANGRGTPVEIYQEDV